MGFGASEAAPSGARAAPLYVLERLVNHGLVAAGASLSHSMLGWNLTSLAQFAGAVGVGLGVQGVVKEFVSGLG